MALTKADIAEVLQEKCSLPKAKSIEIVETLLRVIKDTLASGEDVLIRIFGKVSIKSKAERRGRNPATGADMMLRARKVVTFKDSGKLRQAINE